MFMSLGYPIGSALSGILLNMIGYYGIFAISASLYMFSLVYGYIYLEDVKRVETKSHDNRGFIYFLKTFFSPRHFLSSLKVIFKKTANNRTLRLCLLIFATCFLFGPMYGEGAILYMSTRYRFGWDELQFSNFQAFNMVVTIIGTLTCVLIISKTLGWHDSIIGILACSSKIASSFIYAFAATGAIFYLGPVVDIFNGNAVLAMRSIFTKTVERHEIGKLNSIVGIFEVVMPLAYVPLYTRSYTATMEAMPGFVFLLGVILSIPTLLVFLWVLYKHLMSVKQDKLRESSPDQTIL